MWKRQPEYTPLFSRNARVVLLKGKNRYDSVARPNWLGRVEKVDPLDKCALVYWDDRLMPEWIEEKLLKLK